jgi:hypothetical protein
MRGKVFVFRGLDRLPTHRWQVPASLKGAVEVELIKLDRQFSLAHAVNAGPDVCLMLDHLLSLLFYKGQLHLIEIRGFWARRRVIWRFIVLLLFVIFNPELEVFSEYLLQQLHVMRA